jgi:hypothetical protein
LALSGGANPSAAGETPVGVSKAGTDRIVELRIAARKPEGGARTIGAVRGERIILQIRSDEEMTIHVHGYDIRQKVTPGVAARMALVAGTVGRFPVTAHLPDSVSGAHGREPTLLYLEVHPE